MKSIDKIIISPNSPVSNNVGWVKTEEDKLTLKFLINGKWKSINEDSGEGGGSTYELPEATLNTLGGVKLGTVYAKANDRECYMPLIDIPSSTGDGVGIKIDSSVLKDAGSNCLSIKCNTSLGTGDRGLSVKLGTDNKGLYTIPCCIGTTYISLDSSEWDIPHVGIPYNREQFCLKGNGLNLQDGIGSGVTKVTWDANSNMNNYTTAGIYDIYGERTNSNDNLPITQAYNGASIAARLTVVASTLQPNNTEKCITQFLQLSNRMGGEGNTYIRTYNENNNGLNGWSEWKKQQGMVESYINTSVIGITATGVQTRGLSGMTENGMYSGIFTDDITLQSPNFVETFVLVVINDYAVSSQAGTPRRISQLKYATDTLTGQCTVKKRVGTGDNSISWGDWEEIGGGGSSEVDITDAVKTYGLPTLLKQGLMKEGVTYKVREYWINGIELLKKLDVNQKIYNKLNSVNRSEDSNVYILIKFIDDCVVVVDSYLGYYDVSLPQYYHFYKFIMDRDCQVVKVSADMIEL